MQNDRDKLKLAIIALEIIMNRDIRARDHGDIAGEALATIGPLDTLEAAKPAEAAALDDLIREFERGNFHHVNDTDKHKAYSYDLCAKTTVHLLKLRKVTEPQAVPEFPIHLSDIACAKQGFVGRDAFYFEAGARWAWAEAMKAKGG